MKGERIRPCLRCHRPTRPARALIADHPGTLIRHGDLCVTCHSGGTAPTPHAPRQSIEEITAGLVHYLQRRRDREHAMLRRAYYEERLTA